jgi:1-deoxy-D-xylulose-5-phosphate synthase
MLLERLTTVDVLKKFTSAELKGLAHEIRDIIIERVSINGGHLASNLGVVELTIALHYVFQSPEDKIIWDVGHQSYTHKLLTGRAQVFNTLRKHGGISGFPKINENIHDAFGTGHSSTSISAALGIAEANRLLKKSGKVIAVIGDGAMTSGLAFEGLNNAGHLKRDLLIVLNDNEMSISENVGALSAYLSRIITGEFFTRMKKDTKDILEGIPTFGDSMMKVVKKVEDMVKCLVVPGMLFEELGFSYVGPVDGHSISAMIEAFRICKDMTGPVLVHTITKKGKGYEPAERYPELFHGTGPFDIESGKSLSASGRTYSEVFGSEIVKLADKDERIVAITAAMCEGTGLTAFRKTFPDRFFDIGIAESHATTFAAGLAISGLRPVVAIYSTFLQRAYDEIIHDVCLQNLPVIFAIDRGGIVGDDGPTHNGSYDISFLRHIPNLVLMAPKSGRELKDMLHFALKHNGPVAIRYPRGKTTPEFLEDASQPITLGKAEVLTEGRDLAIIAVGNMVNPAVEAARMLAQTEVRVTVVNARFIKPLDEGLLKALSLKTNLFLTVEENALQGGFGSAVLEYLADLGIPGLQVRRLGIPDRFVEQGPQEMLRREFGLSPEGITVHALSLVRSTPSSLIKKKVAV